MAHVHMANIEKTSVLRGQDGIIQYIKVAFSSVTCIFTKMLKVLFYTTIMSVGIIINYESIIIITVYIIFFYLVTSIFCYISLTAIFLNNVWTYDTNVT